VAIISRTLEAFGFKVAILAQPDWRKPQDLLELGLPRLAFMVSGGNIDSMVNHYSVNRKKRKKDLYSDEGIMGKRPDRATIVYSRLLKQAAPKVPVILGGIEASLRRLSHYDYWDDKVRPSILLDAKADLLIYGMAENTVVEVAQALNSGLAITDISWIRGTVIQSQSAVEGAVVLPSFQEVKNDKKAYAQSFKLQNQNRDAISAKVLVEPYSDVSLVVNPPALPLTRQEMDDTYSYPYMRTYHPKYKFVPAIEEVRFSLISNRGCFGSCAFCALTYHQGRVITSRSKESLVKEAIKITEMPDFKGYIHDVGGPTANFHQPSCQKAKESGACVHRECLHPRCKNLEVSHKEYADILETIGKLPKVKKVFVRSGIRYDYLLYDKDDTFFRQLVLHHISGQLKVAPEHISNPVLDYMKKPHHEVYEKFVLKFEALNREYNKNQFLVPYLMSSHPGSTLQDAIALAQYLKKNHKRPQQVQDFYPTPMTLATAMYYLGFDPLSNKPVYIAKTNSEKLSQRVLLQPTLPKNRQLVLAALKEAGRSDLIGEGADCLINNRPYRRTYDKHH